MVRSDCHYLEQGISDMSIILDKARDVQGQEWYGLTVILSKAGDFRYEHYLGQSQKPTDLDLHCLQGQGISEFSRTRFLAHGRLNELPHIIPILNLSMSGYVISKQWRP